MQTEIVINGLASPRGNYITWSPVQCPIRFTQADGAADPVRVRLRNRNPQRGGQVLFFSAMPAAGQNKLRLDLPVDGAPVGFLIAGQLGRSSTANRDASIEVTTLFLAKEHDEYAQRRLHKRLQKRSKTLVPPAKAIQLLGYDIHAEHYLILKKIVKNPPSVAAKKQAVRLLGTDNSSKALLKRIRKDKNEAPDVRAVSATALQALDPIMCSK